MNRGTAMAVAKGEEICLMKNYVLEDRSVGAW